MTKQQEHLISEALRKAGFTVERIAEDGLPNIFGTHPTRGCISIYCYSNDRYVVFSQWGITRDIDTGAVVDLIND